MILNDSCDFDAVGPVKIGRRFLFSFWYWFCEEQNIRHNMASDNITIHQLLVQILRINKYILLMFILVTLSFLKGYKLTHFLNNQPYCKSSIHWYEKCMSSWLVKRSKFLFFFYLGSEASKISVNWNHN